MPTEKEVIMKNKTYTDISVVVQGPVQSLGSRGQEQGITNKCLNFKYIS